MDLTEREGEKTIFSLRRFDTKLCIIGHSIGQANVQPFEDLIQIIDKLCTDYTIIVSSSDQVTFHNAFNPHITYKLTSVSKSARLSNNLVWRISYLVYEQFWISYCVAILAGKTDIFLVFVSDVSFFPIVTAKLLRKKVVLLRGGYTEKEIDLKADFITKIYKPMIWLNFRLANNIVLYSKGLIEKWNMQKFSKKILIASRHFVNLNIFCIKRPFTDRDFVVGYIGIFNNIKNSSGFIEAIKILKDNRDIKFLIGGKGPLQSNVEMALKEIDRDFPGRVKYVGWIPHHELPLHLNDIRLLVIPSYSEGLPNLMLESMACGTPVLASPVGSIPDVISDNVNGFLLDNNSAEGIAKGVMKCRSYQKIDDISTNARKFVEDNYSFQSALTRYTEVLKRLEEQLSLKKMRNQ